MQPTGAFVTEELSKLLQPECIGPTCDSPQVVKKQRVVKLLLRSQLINRCKIEAIEITMICQDINTLKANSVFGAYMKKQGKLITDSLIFPRISASYIGISIGFDQM